MNGNSSPAADFQAILFAAREREVIIPRESPRAARAFRQRLYRLRDDYTSRVRNADARSLAHLLALRVEGRYVHLSYKDPALADQLILRIAP